MTDSQILHVFFGVFLGWAIYVIVQSGLIGEIGEHLRRIFRRFM